jgi:hypothetical protein
MFAVALLCGPFMGLPLLACVVDRCSSFVKEVGLAAQGQTGIASSQDDAQSKRTW